MKWINIFKTGTHTDSSGRTRTWTDADLSKIIKVFNQRTEDPPVVFGHPQDNEPAEGWIVALRKSGDFLQAQFARLSDKAKKSVKNKRHKYGSLSLTTGLRIRHFGLLGAVPPAVKGLGEVEFEQGDDGITVFINFNEPEPPADKPEPEDDMTKEMEARIKELEKQTADEKAAREKAEADLKAREDEAAKRDADQRAANHAAHVDKLIEDGKLLPADKPQVLAFCEALDGGEEMSFNEGEGKKPLTDHFLDFMARAKSNGLMHEFNAPASGGDEGGYDDLTQYV
tara:strand:- start:3207 stop:4058 length:852 start_codon:yes stop_codon:yes gene_type:complete